MSPLLAPPHPAAHSVIDDAILTMWTEKLRAERKAASR